jgi:hypothetical protein
MIHYLVERDHDGMPVRLVWSSAIQEKGEELHRSQREKELKMKLAALAPMPAMRKWAEDHGIIF